MKLKYLILAGAALMGLASCSDFLDKPTDTRVTLTSTEQLRMLMVSAYPDHNYGLITELSTDNFIDNNSPSLEGIRYNLPSYSRNDDEAFAWEDIRSETGSDYPSGLWEGYYSSIATCNAVLEKVEEFENEGKDSEKLQAVKGEALVDRAYCHFMLANIFCMPYQGPTNSNDPKKCPGIPYITSPETTVKPHYERGTLAQTYEMIEKDLTAGLPLINDVIYEVPKYHFNKQAAYTFASRFYLFKREYDKVVEYANVVFGGANADPSPYMSDIWAQTNLNYANEYARYYAGTSHMRNFLVIPCYSTYTRHIYGGHRYGVNREAMRGSVRGPGPTWERCRYQNTSLGWTWAMHPCFSAMWTNGSQEYGVYWAAPIGEQFEYTDKVAGIGYAHNMMCEFTGEEALLNRAEAKLFLGDVDGAIADLGVWEAAHRISPNVTSDGRMDPWSKEIVYNFYTKCATKYKNNYQRTDLGTKYNDSTFFGIAKPINIDVVCPSDRYKLTADIEPYLQCVQHFRRIEFIHRGMRWFDIKRFGLSFKHVIGKDARVETLQVLDPRLALQIPNEIIAAGIDPNNRNHETNTPESSPKVAPNDAVPYND